MERAKEFGMLMRHRRVKETKCIQFGTTAKKLCLHLTYLSTDVIAG